MKYVFSVILLAICASGFSQIVGGAGICHVSGNPNQIDFLKEIDQRQHCTQAIDTLSGDTYTYNANLPFSQRWQKSECEGRTITQIGHDFEFDIYPVLPVFFDGTAYVRATTASTQTLPSAYITKIIDVNTFRISPLFSCIVETTADVSGDFYYYLQDDGNWGTVPDAQLPFRVGASENGLFVPHGELESVGLSTSDNAWIKSSGAAPNLAFDLTDLAKDTLRADTSYRVANVAQLKSALRAKYWRLGRVVTTDGFYQAGDGGGGKYLLEAGTGNDTLSFTLSGLTGRARLIANEDGGINVLQTGAKPSLTYNNTRHIQLAIDNFQLIEIQGDTTFTIESRLIMRSNKYLKLGQNTKIRLTNFHRDALIATPLGAATENFTIEGGIWDRTYSGPSTTNEFASLGLNFGDPLDCMMALIDTKLATIKNACFKSNYANGYAIWMPKAFNAHIENIKLDVLRDGVHIQGPADNVLISNVRGTTGDDFIALDGANYQNWNVTEGNLTNITIENINPQGQCGNVVAVFPGSKWSGSTYVEDYYADNIQIKNVYGKKTGGGAIVNLLQYGDPNNPSNRKVFFGSIKNIGIDGIKMQATTDQVVVGTRRVENISIENVSANVNGGLVFGTSDATRKTVVNKATIFNYTDLATRASDRAITVQQFGRVKNMDIANCDFKMSNPGGSLLNWTSDTLMTSFVKLSNCNFTGNTSAFWAEQDSLNISATNCVFDGNTIPFSVVNPAQKYVLSNNIFTNIGSYLVASRLNNVAAKVYFGNNSIDLDLKNYIGRDHANVAINALSQGRDEVFEIGGGAVFSLAAAYDIGQRFYVKNTSAVTSYLAPPGGSTIDGASFLTLLTNQSFLVEKRTDTTWVVLAKQ
jgi:hypothetical protein